MNIKQSKELLESNGYYVGNLWSVDDVHSRYECTNEVAQEILNKALTNEATMEQVWLLIDIYAKQILTNKMEENKLIAEFMGMEKQRHSDGRYLFTTDIDEIKGVDTRFWEQLYFHVSWDWLMPVVEKIEFEHDCLVIINSPLQVIITNKDIGQRETPLLDEVFEIEVSDRGTKRDCLYKAIVEFIKQYNRTDDER